MHIVSSYYRACPNWSGQNRSDASVEAIDNNDSLLEIVEYKKRNGHTNNDYLDFPFSGLRLRGINSC